MIELICTAQPEEAVLVGLGPGGQVVKKGSEIEAVGEHAEAPEPKLDALHCQRAPSTFP